MPNMRTSFRFETEPMPQRVIFEVMRHNTPPISPTVEATRLPANDPNSQVDTPEFFYPDSMLAGVAEIGGNEYLFRIQRTSSEYELLFGIREYLTRVEEDGNTYVIPDDVLLDFVGNYAIMNGTQLGVFSLTDENGGVNTNNDWIGKHRLVCTIDLAAGDELMSKTGCLTSDETLLANALLVEHGPSDAYDDYLQDLKDWCLAGRPEENKPVFVPSVSS